MCPLMHRSYSLSLVCAHQYFPLSLAPRFVHFCKPSATPNSFQHKAQAFSKVILPLLLGHMRSRASILWGEAALLGMMAANVLASSPPQAAPEPEVHWYTVLSSF